jgi:hypothetical protein
MEALIVYPENKEQLTAVKSILKAMKISFEQKADAYPVHVVESVEESIKQADEGQLTPYTGIRDMLNS